MTDRREPELPFDPPGGGEPDPAPGPREPAGPKDQVGAEPSHHRQDSDEKRMGLLDHLGELRWVLVHSFLAALVATILCWFWSADLLDILIRPIKDEGIYFTAPNEAFLTRLKLSGAMGLFVVAPFIFFKFYMFILPGLHKKEAKVVTPLLITTTTLFYTGVAFAFLVVIPQVISFLLSFGTQVMEPLIGVGPYFNFVTRLCLAFGLVFQLPLLVLFLSVIGIVNPRMLLRTWRLAIVIIFALSAILTPPDVISQVLMAGPVLVLYLSSVIVAIVVTRRYDEFAGGTEVDIRQIRSVSQQPLESSAGSRLPDLQRSLGAAAGCQDVAIGMVVQRATGVFQPPCWCA